MKKYYYILVLAVLLLPLSGFGQGMYDALRFSQQFYDGTARSLAMGNALTSIGGDMGALSINPAAAGVYRYSEFIVTPSIISSVDNAEYLGYNNRANRSRFSLSNVGYVGYFKTGRKRGLLNINCALSANQTNNFVSRTSASGMEAATSWLGSLAANMPSTITPDMLIMPDANPDYPFYNSKASWKSILAWNSFLMDPLDLEENSYIGATENIDDNDHIFIPGTLRQDFFRQTLGYISDIALSVSGNVNDKFFFGVSVTVQSIYYSHYETYSESAENPALFQTGFSDFTYTYNQATSGTGVNIKGGIIYRPVAGLSIGASISTPTWMRLRDTWTQDIEANFTDVQYTINSPLGNYNYRITSPLKWNVGVSYTFGKIGLISVDYERTNYSQVRMGDEQGYQQTFKAENSDINQYFQAVNNVRAGLEFRIIPSLSIRGGYNYYSSPEKNFAGQKHLASLGLGYNFSNGLFLDVAYQQQCNRTVEYFSLYDDYPTEIGVPVMKDSYWNWRLLFSLGFRF